MNRRHFLYASAVGIGSSLLGLHRLAPCNAVALAEYPAKPTLALIIDDIGFSRLATERFLGLQIPMTFSILPRLPLSAAMAELIHRHGHEIMLHQPMEPLRSDIDPGPGAVYTRDTDRAIAKVVAQNITELPYLVGTNNHMGSRFTQSYQQVRQALKVLHSKNLYFVDSLTTMRSKAFYAARQLAMPTLQRDLFLDPVADARLTFKQLCRLKLRALIRGSAIGIGHPYPETLQGIRQFLTCKAHMGVELVYVSRLIEGR